METTNPNPNPNPNVLDASKDPLKERLRALEMERTNALPGDWPEKKRLELLELQNSIDPPPFVMTQGHHAAIGRQTNAGFGDNPPLTAEEQRFIQEVNSANK